MLLLILVKISQFSDNSGRQKKISNNSAKVCVVLQVIIYEHVEKCLKIKKLAQEANSRSLGKLLTMFQQKSLKKGCPRNWVNPTSVGQPNFLGLNWTLWAKLTFGGCGTAPKSKKKGRKFGEFCRTPINQEAHCRTRQKKLIWRTKLLPGTILQLYLIWFTWICPLTYSRERLKIALRSLNICNYWTCHATDWVERFLYLSRIYII